MYDIYLMIAGAWYVLTSFVIAAEADNKGYNYFSVLIISLGCTPLISAILFSNYKKKE